MTNIEKLTPGQKNEIKQLLNEFAEEISEIEDKKIKEGLNKLKLEVADINKNNVKDFLKDFKAELNVLKEYTEYKNIIAKLEEKLNKIEKEVVNPTKDELANLQKKVVKVNDIEDLSSEEIKKLANA